MSKGLDPSTGRIVDEIGETGDLRRGSSRSWPHADALKSLTAEATISHDSGGAAVATVLARLLAVYCRADLNGGWIDHVDADDRPVSSVMPASTLYHVYFGITSAFEFANISAQGRSGEFRISVW